MDEKEAMHWADKCAEEVIARCKIAGKNEAVCRSGQSPSGPKHIGNMSDNIRSYLVSKAINEKGLKAIHIQTNDDRDPIRKIPPRVADLEGNWKELSEKELNELKKYAGMPYVAAPDPFGCCSSWAEHFLNLMKRGAESIGLESNYISNDKMYKEGKFDPTIRAALEKLSLSREIIMKFQETRKGDFIPFDVICENCGKITAKATAFDLENWTVEYECSQKDLAGEYKIEGCMHKGTTSLSNGKLPWRFEWPAQWSILRADFEPVGKEHAEGSWPSGKEISKEIFEYDPVIPFFTEFFLVNGKKMATREGNAYIIQDVRKILSPEPFKYFYTKKPTKQRDFTVIEIQRIWDEFDKVEKLYFNKEQDTELKEENVKRSYELCWNKTPEYIEKTAFSVCVNTIQIALGNVEKAKEILKRTGHNYENADERLRLAWKWVNKYAPEQYKFVIQDNIPNVEIDEQVKNILSLTADKIGKLNGEEIQNFIFNSCKENNVPMKDVFSSAYKLLLNKERGPKLGPFLVSLDKNFIVNRLKLIK